ncbi:MAG: glutamyl-tRNA reductase [Endomicrobiales bacterium]
MLFEVWGMNHRSAPVETRERAARPGKTIVTELRELGNCGSDIDSVIVSTCNRFEIYTLQDANLSSLTVPHFIARRYGFSSDEIARYFYHLTGEDAVRHLLRVVTSLDSMVIGDAQILGQVREAFLISENDHFAGPLMKRIFNEAFTTGRTAHRETGIGTGPVSVSSLSIAHASLVLGDLENRTVMVVGAGKTGVNTVKHLLRRGVKDIVICNRTFEKACELADTEEGLRAVRFEEMCAAMRGADLVITSTGAPDCIIHKPDVEAIMRQRPEQKLVLIDIAVPRDVDPAVAELANVHLCNIDELNKMRQVNMRERSREAVMVEHIIENTISTIMSAGLISEDLYTHGNNDRHKGQPVSSCAI